MHGSEGGSLVTPVGKMSRLCEAIAKRLYFKWFTRLVSQAFSRSTAATCGHVVTGIPQSCWVPTILGPK